MSKALDFVLREPWAMTADALQTVYAIARRAHKADWDLVAARKEAEAVQAKLGKPIDNTHKASERDGVGVIPVRGPIARYASIFSEVSGATSVQKLATDLRACVENPRIKAVLLDIDSPGGQANGIAELAGHIREASKVKPVCAYVSGMGCSAAYWLASAAKHVVVSPTAVCGSVGVIMSVDTDEDDDEMRFVSSQSPKKDASPNTQEGREEIQALVDSLAEVFIGDVARNRGMKPEEVISRFGEGGVKVGEACVKAGMADAVGSFEACLTSLSRGESPVPPSKPTSAPSKAASKPAMSHPKRTPMSKSIMAWLFKNKPEAVSEALAATEDEPITFSMEQALASLRGVAPAPLQLHKPAEQIEAEAERKAAEKARASLAKAFGKQADAYLAAEVKAERVLPKEVDRLKALYVAFALADDDGPLAYESNSQSLQCSQLDFLTETLASRPKNGKTTESVIEDPKKLPAGMRAFPNGHPEPDKNAKASPEELARLLAMTDLGRSVLAEMTANGLKSL